MPHIIVEYTNNLVADINVNQLLPSLHEVFLAQPETFPIGGIRSRAIALEHYYVADGADSNDAFVHLTLKIGAGRTKTEKDHTCTALFAVLTDHFSKTFTQRSLALSLELYEFGTDGTLKKNTIHERYR
ncbi:5-carboxymethyl-2-hydroxymuconate delta-isomerase [Bacillus sp. JCM 19046]|uniref:5-carboxymethyl-2-hydroxymuconate isomerase n=1 Tax=Shouchella xiaoxiensis TaxID=766895 RepID=A0ABS2SUX1_9BACI|nr:5-carboxymethyl-2-hydroxymuconate Delta-isomerase [Shouchella xiaoxiensis]MBM7839293.1 5-carboxymethyl-2-hydroxymuconate isomerase [Shouchella xiaoxiensis]GAF13014.1 5-carboxymethyl-2-hydroxymuconate delta-isomerase [Bacillus sp. JCM 19045]GAF15669.1 5-carboxymethyl-2-hydroxymuconate delta-isomerase [Bacillus sp. JCM 19046]